MALRKPGIQPSRAGTSVPTAPFVRWGRDQLIRRTRMINDFVGKIIRAYKGEFAFVDIIDSNPSVDTVLQLSNTHGQFEVKELKSGINDVSFKLQNGLYASLNTLALPRDADPDEPALRMKERTSGEYYLRVKRVGANDYTLEVKSGGSWSPIEVNAGCRVYRNANQTIQNSVWTAISPTHEQYDTDAIWDDATNVTRLTCKTAGKYTIAGHITFAEDDPANGYRAVAIRLNGTTYIAKLDREEGNVNPSFSISTLYALAVNDYIELMVFQTAGHALAVDYNPQYSPYFAMQRISG